MNGAHRSQRSISRAAGSASHGQHRRSDKKCRVPDCHRNAAHKTHSSGEKEYSVFCSDHTCRARQPFVNTTFCGNYRDVNNLFCQIHRKCAVTGCVAIGEFGKPNELPFICINHKCRLGPCHQLKMPFASVCERHRAVECAVQYCQGTPQPNGRFCPGHTCSLPGCVGEAQADSRCFQHPCCRKDDCSKVARPGEEFCDKHARCGRADCHIITENSPYCERHGCYIKNCAEPRASRSTFCVRHKCHVEACSQGTANPEDKAIKYCGMHECQDGPCHGQAETIHGFCNQHECMRDRCGQKRATFLSAFCQQHECKASNCHYAARSSDDYCEQGNHACLKQGCHDRRVPESGTDALCVKHLVEENKRLVATEMESEFDDERTQFQQREEQLEAELRQGQERLRQERLRQEGLERQRQQGQEHRYERYQRPDHYGDGLNGHYGRREQYDFDNPDNGQDRHYYERPARYHDRFRP